MMPSPVIVPLQAPRGDALMKPAIEDPEIIAGYLTDASRLVGHAEGLFRPENEVQVAAILRAASERNIPVTVVARQTSTTASSVPFGGWILSMEKLDRLIEIDRGGLRARAEGGILLGAFQKEISDAHLLYPPDPTSRHECTLGGSVACNASGARTFKYGATRKWIEGLSVVLANGSVLRLGRGEYISEASSTHFHLQTPEGEQRSLQPPAYQEPGVKHAAGFASTSPFDLIDLFIGSEGTLGVITEVQVRLLPAPHAVFSIFATFPSESQALAFVVEARKSAATGGPITPRCLEFFDRHAVDILRKHHPELGFPEEAEVALFSEQEVGEADGDPLLEAWFDALTEGGALVEAEGGVLMAETDAQMAAFLRARHTVPAVVNERAAAHGMPKVGTDLAVPDSAFADLMALYHQASDAPASLLDADARGALLDTLDTAPTTGDLNTRWAQADFPERLDTVTFGHIGDNHVHVNFLPQSRQGLALAKAVYHQLSLKAIEMGGTPSAEHGIGKIKREALAALFGPQGIDTMRAIKKALDPQGILGRGNLFER